MSIKYRGVKWLAVLLGIVLVLHSVSQLSMGDSNFLVTVSIYLLLVLFFVLVFRKWKVAEAVKLSVFSILFALFLAEIGLRFVVKRHLVYMEKNGGQYSSSYDYGQKQNRWFNHQYDEDDSSKGKLFRLPILESRS